MLKRIILSGIFILLSAGYISAENVRISQIDSSRLLLNQEVKLYLSITDNNGEPIGNLSKSSFSIFESPNRTDFKKIPSLNSFDTMANYESGINFLLLIDNSGSMYRDMKGKRTKIENKKRISHAKRALITFLRSITNPKDKVGLVSYNSYYNLHSTLSTDKVKIQGYLDEITRPKKDEAFSEIYSSLYFAVEEFSSTKGRKAIIVLSDGKNQPYYRYTKRKHRKFGKKTFKYTEPNKYCQEEGISVFAINFGKRGGKKDIGLRKIASRTGGAVFDAYDQKQLSEIYGKIVNQILNEYLISYSATMDPADKKYVKVVVNTESGESSSKRFYFSSTVFGIPLEHFTPFFIIPILLSLLLLWLLSKVNFEKQKTDPSIEVLDPGAAQASTKLFTLDQSKKTVIGGDPGADMTLSGGTTSIREKHATIVFDKKQKKYTVIADGKLTVNNKPVKTKFLESGDVINVGGSTIVFDDGEV